MADPPATSPTSPTSEPLPIAIIGMYVVTHTPTHTNISIEKFLFSLLLFFFVTNKKKITKSIGAGIAGLALAIGLYNSNHHPCILYEEASEFSAVGYVHMFDDDDNDDQRGSQKRYPLTLLTFSLFFVFFLFSSLLK